MIIIWKALGATITMILEIIGDVLDEAFEIWDDAKSDWRFAKKQMDQIQAPSLYRQEDD